MIDAINITFIELLKIGLLKLSLKISIFAWVHTIILTFLTYFSSFSISLSKTGSKLQTK